ncbi:MAG TPA: NAD(P)-dependent alcohol dehydrogenase, partial [Gaiellaceae bacterium]|nr:NAD(P)-dependent alcohol dehydrogenase [Gaiellaceae bacterium]
MSAGTMRAVVHDRYGPPEILRVDVVERPVHKADEVLVQVRATTVNRTDCHIRSAKPFLWRVFGAGLLRPKQRQSGSDFAGEVVAVGDAVTSFAVGDRVFGSSGYRFGAHAEYVCVRAGGLIARKPDALSFEEAAAIPDGALAARATLRRIGLHEGQRIVVYGASGALGTAAVQLAKHLGAHVTAVCNTKNVELVRSLGADRVVDYTREDFTTSGETYDVVLDAVQKHSFRRSRRALVPGGLYVATDLGFLWHVPHLALLSRWVGSRKVVVAREGATPDDLALVAKL